ncbi:unnamed protein product [Brachionus calyciflorus]|uniref:Uncharacterized protein n=1 Tax=Brachionus calyciflorus TaxID=104777 RepID=A0A813N7T1_9BILA|nr:unnamed protein product [Brachionus calyciflorus]
MTNKNNAKCVNCEGSDQCHSDSNRTFRTNKFNQDLVLKEGIIDPVYSIFKVAREPNNTIGKNLIEKVQNETLSSIQRNQIIGSIRDSIRNKTISNIESSSSKNLFYKSISLNTESFIRNLLENEDDNELRFDICEFLDTYSISRDSITIIQVDKLEPQKECELYLKKHCGNDQIIKYPLVFIHGVFFGSDEEILLGHSKGFLFELFRDTGLYNMSMIKKHFDYSSPRLEDNEFEFSETTTSDSEYEIQDDDDENDLTDAIEKVTKTNNPVVDFDETLSIGMTSTVKNFIKSNSIKTSGIMNKDTESLISIDKDSYCELYVNNLSEKRSDQSIKLNDKKNNTLNASNYSDDNFSTSSLILSDHADYKSLNKQNNKNTIKKCTPPGDVLATINRWLKKTKQVIETRNKIIAFKNSIFTF